jgi:hypothetical protein
MNAIKVAATIDDAIVQAIPAFSPMLGRKVELIALDAAPSPSSKVTADELLASRITLPPGSARSQEDIDRAIAEGACGGSSG